MPVIEKKRKAENFSFLTLPFELMLSPSLPRSPLSLSFCWKYICKERKERMCLYYANMYKRDNQLLKKKEKYISHIAKLYRI